MLINIIITSYSKWIELLQINYTNAEIKLNTYRILS